MCILMLYIYIYEYCMCIHMYVCVYTYVYVYIIYIFWEAIILITCWAHPFPGFSTGASPHLRCRPPSALHRCSHTLPR